MALKGKKCESTIPRPANVGAEASQLGDIEQETSARDLSTSESMGEANQKLRMVLESFAKPCVASPNLASLASTSFHAAVDDRATTMLPGIPRSSISRRGGTTSEAIHLANQKLKTILSSLQKPVVFDANLQTSICQTAEGDDEELEIVAAQRQMTVKGGRWFETPRGSLKRIEDEQTAGASAIWQEPIAEPTSLSSEDGRVSPDTPAASDEDQGEEMASFSDSELRFPSPKQSITVNRFQVPDIDEDAESDEEDNDVETFAQNDNGNVDDELEECELREGGVRSDSVVQEGLQGNSANRVSADREAPQSSDPEKTVDHGNFNMEEVCIALGNGNLDSRRMRRLQAGFKMMVAEALGRI